MPVEVSLNTPLAEALHAEILQKLVEVGWGSGDDSDTTLSEYIILMLVNRKNQNDIAAELSGELLSLGPDDPVAAEFSRWLFEQVDVLNARLNGADADNMAVSQDDSTTMGDDQEMEMAGVSEPTQDISAYASPPSPRPLILLKPAMLTISSSPTGPKAMRNGTAIRGGGRDKRIMGQINRALDRTHDSVLHRVRGQSGHERINTHARTPPSGPRMGMGRQPRNMNGRAASIAHGLATGMGGVPSGPGGMNPGMNPMAAPWMMPGQPPQGMDVYSMLEQQSRMMQQMQQQMQQQMMMQSQNRGGGFRQRDGRPLSDRIQHPHGGRRGGHQQNGHGHGHHASQAQPGDAPKHDGAAEAEDVDMAGGAKREPPNPDETVCKFNLNCKNKDCKFAHQSPAAPPGATIDVHDNCSFGAACKNRKCVARHPSPATRAAHQSEQDCKFFPNCTNPHCPFRHPSMPLCRNGADCAVPGCKFTHSKTMCKYNPCTNRYCTFKHEEGQRGTFQDKVWTADGTKEHVSERKFVDEGAAEDSVLPDKDMVAEESAIA